MPYLRGHDNAVLHPREGNPKNRGAFECMLGLGQTRAGAPWRKPKGIAWDWKTCQT